MLPRINMAKLLVLRPKTRGSIKIHLKIIFEIIETLVFWPEFDRSVQFLPGSGSRIDQLTRVLVRVESDRQLSPTENGHRLVASIGARIAVRRVLTSCSGSCCRTLGDEDYCRDNFDCPSGRFRSHSLCRAIDSVMRRPGGFDFWSLAFSRSRPLLADSDGSMRFVP
jgi:hypothetical protein